MLHLGRNTKKLADKVNLTKNDVVQAETLAELRAIA